MSLHLDALYDNWPAVFGYVRKRMGNAPFAAIEDLTSETFLRAIERRDLYHEQGSGPLPWLLTIAHHRVTDWRRRQAHRVTVDLSAVENQRGIADAGSDCQADILDVRAALCRVSDQQRHLLIGHYRDERRLADLVEQPMNRSTASKRHTAALAAMRAVLSPTLEEVSS